VSCLFGEVPRISVGLARSPEIDADVVAKFAEVAQRQAQRVALSAYLPACGDPATSALPALVSISAPYVVVLTVQPRLLYLRAVLVAQVF